MSDEPREHGRTLSAGIAGLGVAIALPLIVFVAHGALFSGWQIDDAGISYAYARNLAAGDGLVAQPGVEPVEGFTNLLWVLILSVALRFVDSPTLVARVLSFVFVLLGFLVLALGARQWFPRRWAVVTAIGLSVSTLITGFPAWTLSGLENGLYMALTAAFVVGTTLARDSVQWGVALGVGWTLLFATRPDAAPLLMVPVVAWASKGHARNGLALTATAAAGFLALTAFRVLYFGDVLPNTYYAKSAFGSGALGAMSWNGASGLLFAGAGALGLLALGLLTSSLVRRAPSLTRLSGRQVDVLTLWLALAISYAAYETMPPDWMTEGRFATPVFLLGPLAVLGLTRRRPVVLAGASVVLTVLAGGYSLTHTPAFIESPPAPYAWGLELSRRLGAVGEQLGTGDETTVLLPDIGGALWENRFQVVDLGGLVDRRIARTLDKGPRDDFFDYVFEERRPDLILVHGSWQRKARLHADARLARDYETLSEVAPYTLYLRSATAGDAAREDLRATFSAPRGDDR